MSKGTFFIKVDSRNLLRVDRQSSRSWVEVHGDATAEVMNYLLSFFDVGLTFKGARTGWEDGYQSWAVLRAAIIIDCALLPAGASISTAKLFFEIQTQSEADDGQSDVHIVEGVFADPIVVAAYGDQLASTTSGGVGAYPLSTSLTSISLNATGIGWITKAGDTLLGTRLKGDIDASEPSGVNEIKFKSQASPQTVTGTPTVNGTTVDFSSVLTYYKTPVFEVEYVNALSPAYPRVRFSYKPDVGSRLYTAWQTGIGIGDTFEATVTGLEPNTDYEVRAQYELAEGDGATYFGSTKDFTTGQVGIAINKAYALSREEL